MTDKEFNTLWERIFWTFALVCLLLMMGKCTYDDMFPEKEKITNERK